MIEITNIDTFGWETAIRGMRNPMNSWAKSDSDFHCGYNGSQFKIGENDLRLMKNLAKSGSDDRKYLRMINVTMDINAPLYWWKEFDTYKVGTVANSCSTMHKIHSKEFTLDDFSHEQLFDDYSIESELAYVGNEDCNCYTSTDALRCIVDILNCYRNMFLETKEKKYWWQMIQLLPSSYNQKRTVQLNYEVLKNMYHARHNHKLDDWHAFCGMIETLPYAKELIIGE